MYYLFLDTETSSLSPSSGEIIEIAGCITEFDQEKLCFKVVEAFQSLVQPGVEIEEKIQNLTGISNADLSLASPRNKVKEDWANWLDGWIEKNSQIQGIIGHSIGFDQGFLKSEGWFLPDTKFIDTLDWAKLILPEFYAINLEYIQEKIGFDVTKLGLQSNILDKIKVHRAMYDTYLCIHVANFLLQEFISLPISSSFANHFQDQYLKIKFNFYPKGELSPEESKKDDLDESHNNRLLKANVSANGHKLKASIDDLLSCLSFDNLRNLEKSCLSDMGYTLNFLLNQIYIIGIKKFHKPSFKFKIHSFGDSSYHLNYIVLQSILQISEPESTGIWENPEKIINFNKQLIHSYFEFGKVSDLASILAENVTDLEYIRILKQFIASHDFLMFHLQNLFQNYEYTYFPDSSDLAVLNIKKQIQQINNNIVELKTRVLNMPNLIIKGIYDNFIKLISESNLDYTRIYKLHNQNGSITFLKKDKNFNIVSFVQNIIKTNNINQIKTELDQLSWESFVSSLELNSTLDGINVEFHKRWDIDFQPQSHLESILNSALQSSLETEKPCLILAGQNSSIKDCQKIVSQYFKYNQYLILGESGSLTKISSKILSGFKGIVIGKVSNLNYLINLHNLKVSGVYIINDPYLYIEEGFVSKELRSAILPSLKSIYLQSISNQIGFVINAKTHFVRSYTM